MLEGEGGSMEIRVYDGETPVEFTKQIGSTEEPFAVWFRLRILECSGMDLTQPMEGPAPE